MVSVCLLDSLSLSLSLLFFLPWFGIFLISDFSVWNGSSIIDLLSGQVLCETIRACSYVISVRFLFVPLESESLTLGTKSM